MFYSRPKNARQRLQSSFPFWQESTILRSLAIISLLMAARCSSEPADIVELFPLGGEQGYQYIDKTGKVVIPSQFSEAGMFRDGRALVKAGGSDGRWGFIDQSGNYVIQPKYKEATRFSEGIAWVTENDGAPTAIGPDGDTLFTLRKAERVVEFRGGFAAVNISDGEGREKWGFTDKKGNMVITARYKAVAGFSEGLAAVMDEQSEWGYIDEDGRLVIPHQFDHAGPFSEGLAIAGTGSSKGVIDRSGKFRVNPMFTEAYSDGDRFLVEQNGKWGWIGRNGTFDINPQFNEAMRFGGQDLAAVRTGKAWGYIGTDGLYKINPQFTAALPFTGSVALVLMERQAGLIGKDGKFKVNPQFGKPSREFVLTLMRDERAFRTVDTDFFNIPALMAEIDPSALVEQNFRSLASTHGMDPERFEATNRHTVIPEKRITADLSLTLYALGNPFRRERVRKNFGGYSYTDEEAVPDSSQPVTGYEYRISLSGKGYGRAASVMKALQGIFPDATLISDSDDVLTLQSGDRKRIIQLTSGYHQVLLRISFAGQEPVEE